MVDLRRLYRVLYAAACDVTDHCISWVDAYDAREAAAAKQAGPIPPSPAAEPVKAARCPFCAVVFSEACPGAPFGPNDLLLCAKCIAVRQPKKRARQTWKKGATVETSTPPIGTNKESDNAG